MTPINSILILLTYKGKALLTFHEGDPTLYTDIPWSFIGGVAQKNSLMRESIMKLVAKETGITLPEVTLIAVQKIGDTLEHFYVAHLTDNDVNHIERSERQVLNFFSLSELEKLFLTKRTRHFVTQYASLVKPIAN